MNVTLLHFDESPNWLEADRHLRVLAAEHPDMTIERRLVETVADAETTRFLGSPSIVVDGVDPFADAGSAASSDLRTLNDHGRHGARAGRPRSGARLGR